VLFVGRLHSGKGITDVLEEFARRRDIDADFLVVGTVRIVAGWSASPRATRAVKPLGELRRAGWRRS